MNVRNTSSNNDSKTEIKNLRFVCPEEYKKCKSYHPKQPEESRCFKDSNVGYCLVEYFNDYDLGTEGIREHGDSE